MSGGLGKRIIVFRKIRMSIEHRDIEIIMMSVMSVWIVVSASVCISDVNSEIRPFREHCGFTS
jgi:hypothetical protein